MARRWHRQTRARPTGGPARASTRQRTANAGPCRQGGQTARQCRREPGPASNPPRARPAALRVHPVRRVRHAACGQPARRPAAAFGPPARRPATRCISQQPDGPPARPVRRMRPARRPTARRPDGPPGAPGSPARRPATCTWPTARHVHPARRPDDPPRAPGPTARRVHPARKPDGPPRAAGVVAPRAAGVVAADLRRHSRRVEGG